MNANKRLPNRSLVAWALYDWGNSAFATAIIAGFFPIFLKDFWTPSGADPTISTLRLGAVTSTAGIIVACLAPILGAIADRGGARKKFLLFFAALGVVMTGGLHFVQKGQWEFALGLYLFAFIGFSGANIFYDSLLLNVAEKGKLDSASALGYSLGYLGGGLFFLGSVLMVMNPATFGFADKSGAVRLTFLLVAAWWALFTLPLLFVVREPAPVSRSGIVAAIRDGMRQLFVTFQDIRKMRMAFMFLAAYWLYIDGVDTIVLMAVDYGMNLGFDSSQLILALLITQFVGFPAAIAFGKIGERIGAKRGILIALCVYLGVTVWGYRMNKSWEFFVLAIVIGLVQGGVQALSRSLYASLIPPDKAGEFFGFYNMLGKFAAVLGPTLMGVVGRATGNPRLSILAIAVLFISGGILLWQVKPPPRSDLSSNP